MCLSLKNILGQVKAYLNEVPQITHYCLNDLWKYTAANIL